MAILVDGGTRILLQGITGHTGANLAGRMRDEGSPLVAGVSPGRAGGQVAGAPVFASCREAVAATGADASFVCVPARLALDAVLEAVDAGLRTIVVYAEGVPVHDAMLMSAYGAARGAHVLGPNSAGCISPGQANLSDLNGRLLVPGPVGIVSKSGTLTYEVIAELNRLGLGQSSVVCLGGDPVVGASHADLLAMFDADPATEAVVLIGEIGGRSELDAADVVARMGKPVVAYIAGLHAPAGKSMGHAGALLGSAEENVPGKRAALAAAGASVVPDLLGIAEAVAAALAPRRVDETRRTERR
jgi:succinyl-CoA synthetase alpha subunit